jgi:hypothetical protein
MRVIQGGLDSHSERDVLQLLSDRAKRRSIDAGPAKYLSLEPDDASPAGGPEGGPVGLSRIIGERRELKFRSGALSYAIDEIPHGFCLFDSSAHLICCNAEYLRLYGLTKDEAAPGASLANMIENRLMAGVEPAGAKPGYVARVMTNLPRRGPPITFFEFIGDRTISICYRSCDGGWMALHKAVPCFHQATTPSWSKSRRRFPDA